MVLCVYATMSKIGTRHMAATATSRTSCPASARTSVFVADEAGEIALGALALPHLFVDLRQTGARHEALGDLIRQRLGVQEWPVGEDPHVPQLVRDGRLELVLRQLADEVLFGRQQKSMRASASSTETISRFFGTAATATLCAIFSFAMNC